MKNADLTLYRSKASGRNRFAFAPEMNHAGSGLPGALDSDLLEIAYQPIVALKSNRIAGVAAVGQWTHPSRGTLLGADLMRLAEEIPLAAAAAD
jgi:EAL domain-containing protein (putative c-di-GMP-specific phosphodiesterase class I)